MSESTEPAEFAEPASAPSPSPSPEYGAYTPAVPEPEPVPGDPLRGLLAGAGVALLGVIAWAAIVYATKYEVGIVAVLIGYGVGYAMHRVGRVASTGMAAGAAAIAAAGILFGFVLVRLIEVKTYYGIGVLDALDAVGQSAGGWLSFIGKAPDDFLGWLFLVIGAFAAFRQVAQQRRVSPRR